MQQNKTIKNDRERDMEKLNYQNNYKYIYGGVAILNKHVLRFIWKEATV